MVCWFQVGFFIYLFLKIPCKQSRILTLEYIFVLLLVRVESWDLIYICTNILIYHFITDKVINES